MIWSMTDSSFSLHGLLALETPLVSGGRGLCAEADGRLALCFTSSGSSPVLQEKRSWNKCLLALFFFLWLYPVSPK